MIPKGKRSDKEMNYILLFVIGVVATALILPFVISEAEAFPTIEVTPVEGSRIPGCQDTEEGCFKPNDIRTKVGSLIIFKNTDESAHSFTSNKFNSQLMINDGQEFTWIVEQGVVEYTCLLHPWKVGTITGLVAPTTDDFDLLPRWVLQVFEWYEDDVIDYDTFMNAIIWLMSYDIIIESTEPDVYVWVPDPPEDPPKSDICENVLCN